MKSPELRQRKVQALAMEPLRPVVTFYRTQNTITSLIAAPLDIRTPTVEIQHYHNFIGRGIGYNLSFVSHLYIRTYVHRTGKTELHTYVHIHRQSHIPDRHALRDGVHV